MAVEINLTPTASIGEISSRGRRVPIRTWGTASECRAAALLVHGLGAHGGWFESLGRRLKVRRVYSLAFDLTGFGSRKVERFVTYEQWLEDLMLAAGRLKEETGGKPMFLIGNSMGAVIAAQAASTLGPAGLVLLTPGFEGYPGTFTLSYRLRTILRALINPECEFSLPYDWQTISRDPSVRQWIAADSDKRLAVPGKMAIELLKLTRRALEAGKIIQCPTLMVTAGDDRIVDNRASERFFKRLSCAGKEHRHFDEAWHDLPFDPAVDELVEDLVQFMTRCAPESASPAESRTG